MSAKKGRNILLKRVGVEALVFDLARTFTIVHFLIMLRFLYIGNFLETILVWSSSIKVQPGSIKLNFSCISIELVMIIKVVLNDGGCLGWK